MRNKFFLLLLCLCLAVPAFAEVGGYIKTEWTGGGANAMDGITTPSDGDICYVFGTIDAYKVTSAYQFDSSSSATESGIINIAPDDSTAGRWIQFQAAYCFGTVEPTITDGVIWFDTTP